MRFWRFAKLRVTAPSKQRLAAARRALQRERERAGLFVDELGPKETPDERIARQDEVMAAYWQRMRDFQARRWREARRQLFELPEDERRRILDEWRTCGWPGTPEYLLTFIRWQLNGKRWWYAKPGDDLTAAAFEKEQSAKEQVAEEQLSLF